MPKRDLTNPIKIVCQEIVNSKIRGELLVTSNKQFAQMELNNNEEKTKHEGIVLALKSRIIAQAKRISNQAKHSKTLFEKIEMLTKEVEMLTKEVETFKIENIELAQVNEDLLVDVDGLLLISK